VLLPSSNEHYPTFYARLVHLWPSALFSQVLNEGDGCYTLLAGAPATYVPKVENKPTLLVEILEATDLKVADRNGQLQLQFPKV
jgi:hypothetical protein